MSKKIDKQQTDEVAGEFLAENAEFFAQAFAALNPVFDNPGPMRIVSEESEMTVVIGVKEKEEDGAMDVDCILLDPDQESLRDCVDSLEQELVSVD
ncbi:MAG: hypothetical protein AB8F34_14465 [Akkermansiaceae bacterium]